MRHLALLAAFSRRANFPVGCSRADPAHCHRSVLEQLRHGHGADLV
jgi:hypothetical protein